MPGGDSVTHLPVATLVDEALRLGKLWLEDDQVHAVLPEAAGELLDELRQRKDEVPHECRQRWLQPGIPYEEWLKDQYQWLKEHWWHQVPGGAR
jgi:hypothetical protein